MNNKTGKAKPAKRLERFENVSNKVPIPMAQLVKSALQIVKESGIGRFVRIGGDLQFVRGSKIEPISNQDELMALMGTIAVVVWRSSAHTKGEFLAALRKAAREYEFATEHPHFPPQPGVLYTRPAPEAKHTGELDALVDMFCPDTLQDRRLIKAFILTLFWGGKPGKRPAFVITSDADESDPSCGRGVGKTTLVEILAGLVGGAIRLQHMLRPERIATTMQSRASHGQRVVLIDNVKTNRFSSSVLEEQITADRIDGHCMYTGRMSRPNYMVHAITINGASLSKDLAHRSIVIQLKCPENIDGSWFETVQTFIVDNFDDIVADIRWHLEVKSKRQPSRLGRWAEWQREVLACVKNPNSLYDVIEKRQQRVDDDDDEANTTAETIRMQLKALLPDTHLAGARVVIPARLLAHWLRPGARNDDEQRGALRRLSNLHVPNLRKRRSSSARSYEWTGKEFGKDDDTDSPTYIVECVPGKGRMSGQYVASVKLAVP